MDDLLTEFLTETNESLETIDNELVRLEQNPNDKRVLDNIFRLVHTIKGTCGFLGLPRLESVAHAGENVLGKFRDGALVVTPDLVSLILASLDRIKEILGALASTGTEPEGSDADLIAKLDDVAESGPAPVAVVAPEPTPVVEAPVVQGTPNFDPGLGRALKPGEVSLEELEAVFLAADGPEAVPVSATPAPVPVDTAKAKTARAATPGATAAAPAAATDTAKTGADSGAQSIRVAVNLLEDLMNLVSELVLTRNQLLQIMRRHENSEFAVPLQRLSQCTSELQEGVMKTRMQPIGNAWSKLPRIVRDLSVELNKKIELDMRGAETELDRQVLELIKDPLTHMVRNSADHGIEDPATRLAVGKPEQGTIRLNAYHEGGHIVIQLTDDGRGINTARLARKAVDSGLITESELGTLSEAQLQKLIFHPGLSTAEKVTSVSGRGVGMDVVKSNIEKIGGTIDLDSRPGLGATFAIKIPLTLAIVSSLIVETVGERFAIPQIAVLELVRTAADSEQKIEFINNTPIFRLRNRLLPLINLDQALDLQRDGEVPTEQFIVVTQVGAFTFGIIVDQVFDTEEIVVKPVAPILKDLSVYSGNTILGDGSVIMILDPNGVANAIVSDGAGQESEDAHEKAHTGFHDDKERVLLFTAGDNNPKAVPLSLVARLEDFEVSAIEYAEGKAMVQYRGQLMPLVRIGDSANLHTQGRQPVVVFADGDRNMGLAVDVILDVVDDTLDIKMGSVTDSRVGTAVINGAVTEIIDVGYYIKAAFGDAFSKKSFAGANRADDIRARVLVIDDSTFFRNMLKPLLHAAGYEVTLAVDAEQALKYQAEGRDFDLILSDIEMPGLSGFDLASQIRNDGPWREKPLVALSSLATPADFERGRAVGFNDYVAKFDRSSLLTVLEEQLGQARAA